MFVPQPRSSGPNVHCERVVSKNVESHTTEPCQAEEACQVFENVRDNGVKYSDTGNWSKR